MIVSSHKLVDALVAPVPLELLAFSLDATLRALGELGESRVTDKPASPDNGMLAGYFARFATPASGRSGSPRRPGWWSTDGSRPPW